MSSSKPDAAHFHVLDFYRYVAAVGIVVFHFSAYLPVGNGSLVGVVSRLQLLVDFFFILSGFVIMHVYGARMNSMTDYGVYLRKRLARLYPLHVLTLALYVLLAIGAAYGALSIENPDRYSADGFVPNVLLIHAWGSLDKLTFNYPSWSISAEFFVYLLFPLLLLATRRFGEVKCLALAVLLAILIAALFNLGGGKTWTRATYEFGCFRALPSFFAGMAIYVLATGRFGNLSVPRWLGFSSGLVPLALIVMGATDEIIIIALAALVFLTARMELSARTPPLSRRPYRTLGNASYGVYLLHPLVATGVFRVVPSILEVEGAWMFALAGFGVVLTTMAGVLSYHFFEDPMRRLLSAGIHSPQLRKKPFTASSERILGA